MAKINLEVDSDLSPVFSAFTQTYDLIEQSQNEVKQFGKDSATAYKAATSEVDKYGKEVVEGTKQTKELDKAVSSVGKAADKVKQLKQEVKALTSQSVELRSKGDILGADAALKAAGALKDEINDINAALKSVSGNTTENLGGALRETTSLAVTGFEAATAASALFGTQNEEVEKTLLKLNAVRSLANITQELGGIGDKLKEIKLGFSPVTNSLKDLYTSGNAGLKTFFKEGISGFGKFNFSAKDFFKNIGAGIANFVKSGVAGIKTVGAAISANPLGVILVVIAAIIGAMVLLKDKVKPIAEIFKALGEIIDAVGDGIKSVAQNLKLVASETEENLTKQIEGTEKLVQAIGDRYDYEARLAAAAGKDTEEIERKKVVAQRQAIQQQIGNLYALAQIQGNLSKEQKEQLDKAFEERKKLIQDENVLIVKQAKEAADKKKEADEKAKAKAKEQYERLKALRKEFSDAMLDLAKKSEQAELSLLSGEAKIMKQKQISEEELKVLRDLIEKKGKALDKNFKFTAEQEAEFANLQKAINQTAADALVQIEIDKGNRLAQARKKEADDELAFLDLQTKLKIAQVEGKKTPNGIPEAQFELTKQKAILEIQRQAAIDSLAIKKKQLQAEAQLNITAAQGEIAALEGKDDTISNLKRQQAQESIAQIKKTMELEGQVLEQETENQINKLSDQINDIDKKVKPKGFSLGKLFGLDDKSMGQMQDAIQTTIESLKQLSDEYFAFQQEALDKELAANDERLASRESNIEDLKARLAEEEALQAQGLANDVDRIKERIAQENAAKDAAIKKEKEIKEEKRKLAKQQLIIDTALQASQLVLAIAQLFANGSSFWVGPVPVGLIVAGLAATAMTASFILGKKKAFDAVNSGGGQFKTGGYTGDAGVDEVTGEVHGQEFVHTAEKTRKYRNLFEGIHQDNKPLMEKGLAELLKGTGVVLHNPHLPNSLMLKKDAAQAAHVNAYFKNDNSGVEERIDRLEAHLKEMKADGKNKTDYLADGTIVIKKGSNIRVIKKS